MILDIQEISRIIKTNPGLKTISKMKERSRRLKMHLYGEDLEVYLKTVDGFEKEALRELRVKYTKSNRDLFSRIMRPSDKVFSARGGSRYFYLQGEEERSARVLSGRVREGYSSKSWIQSYWKPHHLDDPGGLMFIEVDGEGAAYPTYKSIGSIYDYRLNGGRVEWVVFRVEGEEKKEYGVKDDQLVYRVVDDLFDYIVVREGEMVRVLNKFTFPNYFMRVPAMVNSDIIDPKDDMCRQSFVDDVIELADEFLLKASIRVTHEFLHGFPKYWQYAVQPCEGCAGSGYQNGGTCQVCKGSKISGNVKVSDVILLLPPDRDNPPVTPNVAGYVSPDKNYHEMATEGMKLLEDMMVFTLWGSHKGSNVKLEQSGEPLTATQAFLDIQPVHDRLCILSEMAEKRDKFMMDLLIDFNIRKGYSGCSVNYGRRYLIESPDVIMEKYVEAKGAKASWMLLNDLLGEYYETKYQGDPIQLAICLKLMRVEPFVHRTIEEVKGYGVAGEDLKMKIFFDEWVSQKKIEDLFVMDEEELVEDLRGYSGKRVIQEVEKKEEVV